MAPVVLGNQKPRGRTAAAARPITVSPSRAGRQESPIRLTELPAPYAIFRMWRRKVISTTTSAIKAPAQAIGAAPASQPHAGQDFSHWSISRGSPTEILLWV